LHILRGSQRFISAVSLEKSRRSGTIARLAQFLHKSGTTASANRLSRQIEDSKTARYVNMADINRSLAMRRTQAKAEAERESVVDLIELLFFAYRDFISDPDAILARSKFGRAHHRVLHFVDRNPGLTVADLLDILKITKQSLARVLKELVDSGYIEQRTGAEDRRQRLLHATPAGQALSASLSAPQESRIKAALAGLGPDARATVTAFLFAMINAPERAKAARLVDKEEDR
jgi:DNA-binding MarR family transcriptional regulator